MAISFFSSTAGCCFLGMHRYRVPSWNRARIPDAARLQWQLAEDMDPARMHIAASVETALILAQAGFGLAMVPEFHVPQGMCRIPIPEAPSLSFGAFYPSAPEESDLLKAFLRQLRREISQQQADPK